MKDFLLFFFITFSLLSVPADIFYIKKILKRKHNDEVLDDDNESDDLKFVKKNSIKYKDLINLNKRFAPAPLEEKTIFRYEFMDEWKYKTFDFKEELNNIALTNYDSLAELNSKMVHNQKIKPEYERDLNLILGMQTNMTTENTYRIECDLLKENTLNFITRAYIYIYRVLLDENKKEVDSEHKVYDLDVALGIYLKSLN